MAALCIGDTKIIACLFKIKAVFFDIRLVGIEKVDKYKAAVGANRLVEQTAALSEIDVLGILTDFGDFGFIDAAIVVFYVDDRADKRFKRGGRRKSAAAEHVGG